MMKEKFSPSMTKHRNFFEIVKKECISKSGTDDSHEKLQNLKKTQGLEEGELLKATLSYPR